MDTIEVNKYHLTAINEKEIRFSGVVNDYAAVQTGVDTIVCVAPYAMKLISFTIRAEVVETAGGTVDVHKVASGTALSSGTAMVTQLTPTAVGGLTALTNLDLTLHATEANYTVAAGDLVALMLGTTGELTGLAYLAVFERV